MFSLRQKLKFHNLRNLDEGRQATTTQTGRKESVFYTRKYYESCTLYSVTQTSESSSFITIICSTHLH